MINYTKPTLLLVEDTASLSMLYTEYLKSLDVQLQHANNGKLALECIEKLPPDLILLDLMLPDTDGIQILKHMQIHDIKIPTIVITAHGTIDRAVEAMRAGAYDFVTKPFNQQRILLTIKNALEVKRINEHYDKIKNFVRSIGYDPSAVV